MKSTLHIALLLLLLPALAWANTVTFDPLPAGTTYSAGAYAPGDHLFSEDSADVYIAEFFSGGTPYFDFARVENATATFGAVRIMNTNNVDLLIDFTAAGDVTFEYLDMGGSVNLQVNGYGSVLEAGDLSALVGTVAPGVTMNCTVVPVGGGHEGVVTLTGPVQKLVVGGQEFWLDNLDCDNGIIPDPGDCDYLVDHQSLPPGTVFDSGSYAPGDWIFNEDGIDVTIHELDWGSGAGFNYCEVVDPGVAGFGSLNAMLFNNVTNLYHIDALGVTVAAVTFEYLDYGGLENLQVNGATRFIGDLDTFPAAVAPGVTMTVTPTGPGYEVELVGDVQQLLVGGQEFFVDEICVIEGEPAPDDCDFLVDHESLGPGDAWGSPFGNAPGDWIFAEDGIDVTIHELQYAGGGAGFNYCRVEVPGVPGFGFNHTMQLNNVSNRYHIDSLGISVAMVKFEYLDWGGTENLQVNGGPLHIGDIETFPAAIAPGVVMVQTVYPVGGGIRGEVVLYGEVEQLLVGGQEFFIDDVCVVEGEPLECDRLVDHESLSIGDAWGSSLGHAPGDLAFVEDGIPVHLDRFVTGGSGYFHQCQVVPTTDGMGDARVMNLNNISNVYGIGAVGAWVAEVTFEFLSYGGDENLEVNGAGRYVGDIESAPAMIAPGVTYSVTTTPVTGGLRGTGRLVGPVDRLLLGGQEFYVDNICVKLHPSSGVNDGLPGLQGSGLELRPNFPNPFNPRTTLGFRLERDAEVQLTIHDMAGRRVRTLVAGHREAGNHQVVWNGTDERGAPAAAGVYLVRVATDDGEVKTRKIGLIK